MSNSVVVLNVPLQFPYLYHSALDQCKSIVVCSVVQLLVSWMYLQMCLPGPCAVECPILFRHLLCEAQHCNTASSSESSCMSCRIQQCLEMIRNSAIFITLFHNFPCLLTHVHIFAYTFSDSSIHSLYNCSLIFLLFIHLHLHLLIHSSLTFTQSSSAHSHTYNCLLACYLLARSFPHIYSIIYLVNYIFHQVLNNLYTWYWVHSLHKLRIQSATQPLIHLVLSLFTQWITYSIRYLATYTLGS